MGKVSADPTHKAICPPLVYHKSFMENDLCKCIRRARSLRRRPGFRAEHQGGCQKAALPGWLAVSSGFPAATFGECDQRRDLVKAGTAPAPGRSCDKNNRLRDGQEHEN